VRLVRAVICTVAPFAGRSSARRGISRPRGRPSTPCWSTRLRPGATTRSCAALIGCLRGTVGAAPRLDARHSRTFTITTSYSAPPGARTT
jgi:hypothetical protein